MTDFAYRVFRVTQCIPKGKVTTYQAVAEAIGQPRASRAVANALGTNEDTEKTPCHRVVRSTGEVGGYRWGTAQKIQRLQEEGVQIRDTTVESRYILTQIL